MIFQNVISAGDLCKILGLNERFFKNEAKYNIKLERMVLSNVLFLKLPLWLEQLINDGYVGMVLEKEQRINELDEAFEIVFKLTNKTTIGLFKYANL